VVINNNTINIKDMKLALVLLTTACMVSCGFVRPVTITYTDAKSGVRVSERVGDGVFAPHIDLGDVDIKDVQISDQRIMDANKLPVIEKATGK
jgi:hypothetical protein